MSVCSKQLDQISMSLSIDQVNGRTDLIGTPLLNDYVDMFIGRHSMLAWYVQKIVPRVKSMRNHIHDWVVQTVTNRWWLDQDTVKSQALMKAVGVILDGRPNSTDVSKYFNKSIPVDDQTWFLMSTFSH
jgi:hypothetical protein